MPVAADATLIVGTGAVTLLTIGISYTFATARRAQHDMKVLRHENAVCTWRQAVLIETMHSANLPVPSWIWGDAPDGVEKLNPEQQRTMAARMIDPFGGVDPDTPEGET